MVSQHGQRSHLLDQEKHVRSDHEGRESITEYMPGDEAEIVKMHQAVFKSGMDINRWKWKFTGHPSGKGWISVARSGPEIIGQYCMMRQHLNFLGREITAGQSCDTFVRPDQVGKRWFTKLGVHNYGLASGNGAAAVFGFPNRESYPGSMKHLGWVRLFNLDCYHYRLGLKKIIGDKLDRVLQFFIQQKKAVESQLLLKRRIESQDLQTIDTFPENLDIPLREINTHEVLSIWKDAAYFKWRYENHPQFKYLFHSLSIDGTLGALVVTKMTDGVVHICETLSRTKDLLQTQLLLYHVMLYAIGQKAQHIAFFGHDDGFFDSVFHAAHFKKEISGVIFGGRIFEDNRLMDMFKMPHNWTVALGDIDVF